MKILVVDDDSALLMTLVANLEEEGFSVEGAADGEEALQLVTANTYDLVLSDIRMPGMNGVELFHRIKALNRNIPVVLMTAFAMENHVQDAILGGVFAVLSKPFDLDSVFGTLRRASGKPTVLVVNGPNQDAKSIASGLASAGLRAQDVQSVEAGVAALVASPIDVCVVDQGPDPAALEAAIQELRRNEPTVTFIVLSGQAEPEMMTRVTDKHAVSFVQRPFDLRDLMRLIAKARADNLAK